MKATIIYTGRILKGEKTCGSAGHAADSLLPTR
jgi:hypothetical protein